MKKNTDIAPNGSKIRYVYAVSPRENRRVTVAYVYDDWFKAIVVATSECAEGDRFEKRVGRGIATSRLLHRYNAKSISYDEMGGDSYHAISSYIRKNIKDITRKQSGTPE